jgi:hypothetical protein
VREFLGRGGRPSTNSSRLSGVRDSPADRARRAAVWSSGGTITRSAIPATTPASSAASAPDMAVAADIHHGIDTAKFLVGAGDGGYVPFLGRTAPEKGPDRAITAARLAGMPIVLAATMWDPKERQFFVNRLEPLLGEDAVFVAEVGGQAARTSGRRCCAGQSHPVG